MGHKSKKRRVTEILPRHAAENGTDMFSKLPFELIAETLSLTSSKEVLAVARTSKFFCNTLLLPSSQFIWKQARNNCLPVPPPPPIARFTESSYAAFIFDIGPCEICGQQTESMYTSFALRVRLCRKAYIYEVHCFFQIAMAFIVSREKIYVPDTTTEYYQTVKVHVPCAECPFTLSFQYPSGQWPSVKFVCRSADWNRAFQDYLDASETPENHEIYSATSVVKSARIRKFMDFCLELHKWKTMFEAAKVVVKAQNEEFVKRIADEMGFDVQDLMNAEAYGQMHRHKTKLLEKMEQIDYNVHRIDIEAQVIRMQNRRKRRYAESKIRQARGDIESHYHRLRSLNKHGPLPSLQTFRTLPMLRLLQQGSSAFKDLNIRKELRSDLVMTLLDDHLNTWRTEAKAALGTTLGYPKWSVAQKNILHPVERLTARFLCTRCNHLETRFKRDGCFDFAGACSHQCPSDKKAKQPPQWKAEIFIKDEKAIDAISKLLKLSDVDVEKPTSFTELALIGPRVLCLDCKSQIVMNPEDVIRHSHRHECMELTLLPSEEAIKVLRSPLIQGLSQRLLDYQNPKIQDLHKLKSYGCRHCTQKEPPSTSLYIFNGLRSHLAAKHGISELGDEDFFCVDEAVAAPSLK